MIVIDALRIFLKRFEFPGESCFIDPIIKEFAEKYYSDNI